MSTVTVVLFIVLFLGIWPEIGSALCPARVYLFDFLCPVPFLCCFILSSVLFQYVEGISSVYLNAVNSAFWLFQKPYRNSFSFFDDRAWFNWSLSLEPSGRLRIWTGWLRVLFTRLQREIIARESDRAPRTVPIQARALPIVSRRSQSKSVTGMDYYSSFQLSLFFSCANC